MSRTAFVTDPRMRVGRQWKLTFAGRPRSFGGVQSPVDYGVSAAESAIVAAMDYTDLFPFTKHMDGSEAAVLCFALDRVRWRFAWKTGGLNAEQLRRQHPPSTMTLAGLIKHMAAVEDGFTAGAAGRAATIVGGDDDFESAVSDEPEALYALWYGAVGRARIEWREISAAGGLGVQVPGGTDTWILNRRGLLVTLLEEYQVHAGHADLLREAVDGMIGNDPPWPEEVPDA